MLLKELKKIFHEELDGPYPVEEVDAFFFRIIEHYFHITPVTLVLEPQLSLTNNETPEVYKALDALKKNKPLQQILGKTSFYGFDLKINEDVLIPRPETEELVQWIVSDLQEKQSEDKIIKILDIGTGSGCIAIALSKSIKNSEVTAVDISTKALELARENAKKLKVNIRFKQQDILQTKALTHNYDIIVSNPPYVRNLEKNQMKANVLNYEPHLALFVPDDDALVFYKKIAGLAVNNLTPSGCLYFEINQYLGDELEKQLRIVGFTKIERRNDLFGHERFIRAHI